MKKVILEMSVSEIERLKIIGLVMAKSLTQVKASEEMGVGYRQVKRIVKRVKKEGNSGVIHRLRGRESGRQISVEKKSSIAGLYRTKYPDFGTTFFNEKLAEAHGIKISTESVRQILIAEGLHKAKVQKDKGVHVWRERKHHAGEMVQIDGSHHRWLEGRLDQEFCLMAYIDDATSKVFARFYEYEGVLPVLDSFEGFVRENGIPISVYLDRHSTYKVNRKTTIEEDLEGEGALTQFQLVMKQLGVKVIYARSPQANGRIERLFETLQDRLVKELRLAGVTTIEGANEFLIPYLEKHNSQFQFTPKQPVSLFKKVPELFDYQWIFSIRVTRTICKDYTIRFCNRVFLVVAPARTLRGQRVVIRQAINGDLRFETKHRILTVKEVTEKAIDRVKLAQKELKKQLKKPPSQTRAQPEHPKSKKSWMDKFHFGKNSFKQTQHQKKEKIPVEA